jgi:hypothetical protein
MINEKIKLLKAKYKSVVSEIERLSIIKTKIEGAYEILTEMQNEQMEKEQYEANCKNLETEIVDGKGKGYIGHCKICGNADWIVDGYCDICSINQIDKGGVIDEDDQN